MYRIEITGSDDSGFSAKSKDYEFAVDTKGRGMTPPDVLLASLGSCVGVYIRKYAQGGGLALDEFRVTVEADLSKEAPIAFKKINVSIDLKGHPLDERRKRALLEFIKNCPVHNTLKSDPVVEIAFSS